MDLEVYTSDGSLIRNHKRAEEEKNLWDCVHCALNSEKCSSLERDVVQKTKEKPALHQSS